MDCIISWIEAIIEQSIVYIPILYGSTETPSTTHLPSSSRRITTTSTFTELLLSRFFGVSFLPLCIIQKQIVV